MVARADRRPAPSGRIKAQHQSRVDLSLHLPPAPAPEKLHRFLPRAKAKRGRRYFKRRRDPIPGRTSIHERPRAVETREQLGHWEGDLMQFRTQRGNLLTPCERKTRFTFTAPLPNKQAETTDDVLREILGPLPEHARRSVTFDNGSEFALHENLNAELATHTYFCDPHSPWQRGTIENTNGLLRRDMPWKNEPSRLHRRRHRRPH